MSSRAINRELLPYCPHCNAAARKPCLTKDGKEARHVHPERLRALGIPSEPFMDRLNAIRALATERGVEAWEPKARHRRGPRGTYAPRKAPTAPRTPEPRQQAPEPRVGRPRPAQLVLYTTLKGREVSITIDGMATFEFT